MRTALIAALTYLYLTTLAFLVHHLYVEMDTETFVSVMLFLGVWSALGTFLLRWPMDELKQLGARIKTFILGAMGVAMVLF